MLRPIGISIDRAHAAAQEFWGKPQAPSHPIGLSAGEAFDGSARHRLRMLLLARRALLSSEASEKHSRMPQAASGMNACTHTFVSIKTLMSEKRASHRDDLPESNDAALGRPAAGVPSAGRPGLGLHHRGQ